MASIKVEDYVAVQNLIGEYQWHVDEGNADAWADLFTEDGAFLGGLAEPIVGREQLKLVPAGVKQTWGGGLRHTTGSMYMRYGASDDEIIAKYYNLVTTWHEVEPKLFTMALSEMHLARRDGEWKIKSNNVQNLARTRSLDELE